MNENSTRTYKVAAGWTAFAAAVLIASVSTVGTFMNRVGNTTEVIGLVTAFLGFATACFGLKSYDRAVGLKYPGAEVQEGQRRTPD